MLQEYLQQRPKDEPFTGHVRGCASESRKVKGSGSGKAHL